MGSYRYSFLDLDGRLRADLTLYSPSEDAARELASELLFASEFEYLELSKGTHSIYRIGKLTLPRDPRSLLWSLHKLPVTPSISKQLLATIGAIEAAKARLFYFETALLEIRGILTAFLRPNRGVELCEVVADIITIIEKTGFPFFTKEMAAPTETPASDGNIVPFPLATRATHKH